MTVGAREAGLALSDRGRDGAAARRSAPAARVLAVPRPAAAADGGAPARPPTPVGADENWLVRNIICQCGTCRHNLLDCATENCGHATRTGSRSGSCSTRARRATRSSPTSSRSTAARSRWRRRSIAGFNRLAWLLPYSLGAAAAGGLGYAAWRLARRPRPPPPPGRRRRSGRRRIRSLPTSWMTSSAILTERVSSERRRIPLPSGVGAPCSAARCSRLAFAYGRREAALRAAAGDDRPRRDDAGPDGRRALAGASIRWPASTWRAAAKRPGPPRGAASSSERSSWCSRRIKEIELDYQMRKIAERDYQEMIERYRDAGDAPHQRDRGRRRLPARSSNKSCRSGSRRPPRAPGAGRRAPPRPRARARAARPSTTRTRSSARNAAKSSAPDADPERRSGRSRGCRAALCLLAAAATATPSRAAAACRTCAPSSGARSPIGGCRPAPSRVRVARKLPRERRGRRRGGAIIRNAGGDLRRAPRRPTPAAGRSSRGWPPATSSPPRSSSTGRSSPHRDVHDAVRGRDPHHADCRPGQGAAPAGGGAAAARPGAGAPPGRPTGTRTPRDSASAHHGRRVSRAGLPAKTLEVHLVRRSGRPDPEPRGDAGDGRQVQQDRRPAGDQRRPGRGAVHRPSRPARAVGYAAIIRWNGMRLGTAPFAMPGEGGAKAEIRALEPAPRDPSVMTIGPGARVVVQMREDTLQFLEMLPLENTSDKLFDPGAGALEIPLPDGVHGRAAAAVRSHPRGPPEPRHRGARHVLAEALDGRDHGQGGRTRGRVRVRAALPRRDARLRAVAAERHRLVHADHRAEPRRTAPSTSP